MRINELLTNTGRSIDFRPDLLPIIGGSYETGVFFSQLLYWCGKQVNPDGWIYKTQEEWTLETGLSIKQQRTARRNLVTKDLLEERRGGIPARLEYRLDKEKIKELWEEWLPAIALKQKLQDLFSDKMALLSKRMSTTQVESEIKELKKTYKLCSASPENAGSIVQKAIEGFSEYIKTGLNYYISKLSQGGRLGCSDELDNGSSQKEAEKEAEKEKRLPFVEDADPLEAIASKEVQGETESVKTAAANPSLITLAKEKRSDQVAPNAPSTQLHAPWVSKGIGLGYWENNEQAIAFEGWLENEAPYNCENADAYVTRCMNSLLDGGSDRLLRKWKKETSEAKTSLEQVAAPKAAPVAAPEAAQGETAATVKPELTPEEKEAKKQAYLKGMALIQERMKNRPPRNIKS